MQGSNEDSQINSMTIGDVPELKQAIHRQLECDSVFRGAELIREQFLSDAQKWNGTVLLLTFWISQTRSLGVTPGPIRSKVLGSRNTLSFSTQARSTLRARPFEPTCSAVADVKRADSRHGARDEVCDHL